MRIGGRNVSESSQMNKPSHQRSSHYLGEVTPIPIKSSQNVLTGFENMEYCKVITEWPGIKLIKRWLSHYHQFLKMTFLYEGREIIR